MSERESETASGTNSQEGTKTCSIESSNCERALSEQDRVRAASNEEKPQDVKVESPKPSTKKVPVLTRLRLSHEQAAPRTTSPPYRAGKNRSLLLYKRCFSTSDLTDYHSIPSSPNDTSISPASKRSRFSSPSTASATSVCPVWDYTCCLGRRSSLGLVHPLFDCEFFETSNIKSLRMSENENDNASNTSPNPPNPPKLPKGSNKPPKTSATVTTAMSSDLLALTGAGGIIGSVATSTSTITTTTSTTNSPITSTGQQKQKYPTLPMTKKGPGSAGSAGSNKGSPSIDVEKRSQKAEFNKALKDKTICAVSREVYMEIDLTRFEEVTEAIDFFGDAAGLPTRTTTSTIQLMYESRDQYFRRSDITISNDALEVLGYPDPTNVYGLFIGMDLLSRRLEAFEMTENKFREEHHQIAEDIRVKAADKSRMLKTLRDKAEDAHRKRKAIEVCYNIIVDATNEYLRKKAWIEHERYTKSVAAAVDASYQQFLNQNPPVMNSSMLTSENLRKHNQRGSSRNAPPRTRKSVAFVEQQPQLQLSAIQEMSHLGADYLQNTIQNNYSRLTQYPQEDELVIQELPNAQTPIEEVQMPIFQHNGQPIDPQRPMNYVDEVEREIARHVAQPDVQPARPPTPIQQNISRGNSLADYPRIPNFLHNYQSESEQGRQMLREQDQDRNRHQVPPRRCVLHTDRRNYAQGFTDDVPDPNLYQGQRQRANRVNQPTNIPGQRRISQYDPFTRRDATLASISASSIRNDSQLHLIDSIYKEGIRQAFESSSSNPMNTLQYAGGYKKQAFVEDHLERCPPYSIEGTMTPGRWIVRFTDIVMGYDSNVRRAKVLADYMQLGTGTAALEAKFRSYIDYCIRAGEDPDVGKMTGEFYAVMWNPKMQLQKLQEFQQTQFNPLGRETMESYARQWIEVLSEMTITERGVPYQRVFVKLPRVFRDYATGFQIELFSKEDCLEAIQNFHIHYGYDWKMILDAEEYERYSRTLRTSNVQPTVKYAPIQQNTSKPSVVQPLQKKEQSTAISAPVSAPASKTNTSVPPPAAPPKPTTSQPSQQPVRLPGPRRFFRKAQVAAAVEATIPPGMMIVEQVELADDEIVGAVDNADNQQSFFLS